jgi:cell division transport system permease protein
MGIFLSLSNNLQHTAQQISKNLVVVVFLNKDITETERNTVALELGTSPQVEKIRYVSAEEAMQQFLEKFPELQEIVENLKVNPFPPSYEVTLKEESPSADPTQPVIGDMQNIPGVEDIQYNKEWVERMQSLSRLAKAVGFFLGGILILASFFIISNVVKLNVIARKEEIGILRLVGGTNSFIRVPFLLEGIILGMLGGALSLLLLLIIIKLFPLYLGSSLGVISELINFRYLSFAQCVLLTASGATIGFLGSYSSLAKFLKV